MKSLIFALAATAMLSGLSEIAFAGGDNGGSKNSNRGTIRVRNNSDEVVAVIVDNEDPPLDEDEFLDAGGKILQPGQQTRFKVAAGDHTLTAAAIDENGDPLGDDAVDTVDVEVERSKTEIVDIDVTDDIIDISVDL
jgi:hypothetical protein